MSGQAAPATTGRRLFLHDYAGHPFTYELARNLAADGAGDDFHSVTYAYCAATVTPRGRLLPTGGLQVVPLGEGWSFEKYRLARRALSELRLGLASVRAAWRAQPTEIVTCNMPVLSLVIIALGARLRRVRLTVWFQDAQGLIAGAVAGGGRRRVGGAVGRLLRALEGWGLRRAARVIAISPAMVAEARSLGVPAMRVRLLENWAPIGELPVRPRDNDWARRHDLVERTCLLYSGTLARKHSPHLLAALAREIGDDVCVIVISEGEGADELRRTAASEPLPNLRVLPYQPFDELPDVLASGDLLLALLDPAADAASVPSKVWSYLCAERPVLAAIPVGNRAAEVLQHADAGVVVAPGDADAFVAAARARCADAARRDRLGANGRRHATALFGEAAVRERFLAAAFGPEGQGAA
ncbi:MAG: glycosyltransferase [Ilumatobacteraceae bacterium]